MHFISDRRTLLVSGGVAAVLFGAPACATNGSVSPKDFGAAGDGSKNDLPAVQKALAYAFDKGLPVDGGDLLYGVAGEVNIVHRARPHIARLLLKQLSPARGQNTLEFGNCEQIRIDSLYIHTGAAKGVGDMEDTCGLQVRGGSGHTIANVTATGNGKVTYVRFWECRSSTFHSIHVHDGQFEDFQEEVVDQDDVKIGTIRVPDDVVQGIHLADCRDCNLVEPVVRNLTGNARTFNTALEVKDYPNFRTRGIAGGGNINCNILNPRITNTEQAIDFSGSGSGWGNRNVQVIGGETRNCGSVGVKFANLPNGCRAVRHIAHNCGMYGFLLTGGDANHQGVGNSFVDCVAINPGYNDVANDTDAEPLAHAGFTLSQGSSGGLVDSRLVGCRAVDNQGFHLKTSDSLLTAAGATSGTMDETWTGYTGTYVATFQTTRGRETRKIILTAGSAEIHWAPGLSGSVKHPFVSRPAKMQYGALCEAPHDPRAGAPNVIADFSSSGHLKVAHKGFGAASNV